MLGLGLHITGTQERSLLGYLNFEVAGYPVGWVLFFWTLALWGPVLAGSLAGWFSSNARVADGWLAGWVVGVSSLGMHGVLTLGILLGLRFVPLPYAVMEHYYKLYILAAFGVPAVAMALSAYLCLRLSRGVQ